MGKSRLLDIRQRVVALVDEGLARHEAAGRLRLSAASAVRIMHRKKRPGGGRAVRDAASWTLSPMGLKAVSKRNPT